MGLFKCPMCGESVSPNAVICMKCGQPHPVDEAGKIALILFIAGLAVCTAPAALVRWMFMQDEHGKPYDLFSAVFASIDSLWSWALSIAFWAIAFVLWKAIKESSKPRPRVNSLRSTKPTARGTLPPSMQAPSDTFEQIEMLDDRPIQNNNRAAEPPVDQQGDEEIMPFDFAKEAHDGIMEALEEWERKKREE